MYFDYREYLKGNPDYQEMVEALKNETELFLRDYRDDSRLLSGWGHAYFCNEDGGRLIYDRKSPYAHRCSICGKVYREYLYNSCHVTMMRNEAVVTAVKCGLLYQLTDDTAYVEAVKGIIGYYADHYVEFAVHAKDKISCSATEDVGGAGKIMPQGLNEAIIAIRLVNAMELVKEKLEPEWLEHVKDHLFGPIVELLRPQKQHIHNIPVWINSAIGEMGLFFQNQDWILEATEKPFHLFKQLREGVTESGFWYEGSIHYNFFALEGVMSFLVFAKAYDYPVPKDCQDIVLHMLDAAYHYAFDNDIFPNPSDGWPNISMKTYSHIYYMGYHALGEKVLPYIKHIEANPLARPTLPLSEPYYFQNRIPLARMLFAPDLDELEAGELEKRCSSNFEASNCATLRNETYNLFFKYGHQTKSHAHPDKMNVEIMVKGKVLTKDLSNSGYASRMCREWHRNIAAHNTCIVNGEVMDITRSGQVLHFDAHQVSARAEAYDQVWYQRDLKLEGDVLLDTFTVDAAEESTVDWLFHLETPADRSSLSLTAVDTARFAQYGEKYMMEPVQIQGIGSSLAIENELAVLDIQVPEGAEVYLIKTYNNPANTRRDTILVRSRGCHIEVKNRITAKA